MATWGEHYHTVAGRMALFRETNRRLAELADLRPGMRVLDLACGSGLTALAALEQVPQGLTLYLADKSPSMLDEARRQVGDRAAAYFTVDAISVATLVPQPVDRVLINMALWYFPDPEAVLRSLRTAIKPTGRLCFNLSGTYFNVGGTVVSPQWAFLRALHLQGLVERSVPDIDRMPNQRSIEGTLMGAGYKPFHFEWQEIESTTPETEPGGELYNLMRLYPALSGGDHREAVARTLTALAAAREEIEACRPAWRAAVFMAQPAISPLEALSSRFAPK